LTFILYGTKFCIQMDAERQYRCFMDDNWGEVWAKHIKDSDQIIIIENIPYYRGMIPSNEVTKQKVIDEILMENGVCINKAEMDPSIPWIRHTYENWREEYPESTLFSFTPEDQVSEAGATYKYFLLPEEGGGWGVLLKKADGEISLITEGRMTNITAGLTGLLEEKNIDFKYEHKHGRDISGFTPKPEDF